MIKSIKRAVIKAKICYYEWALANVRKEIEKAEYVKYFRKASKAEQEWAGYEISGLDLDKFELIQRIEALNLELVRLDWQGE